MLTKYYKSIESLCLSDIRNPDAALDITQEVYARVLAMQAAGEIIRSPSRLLHTIARNLIVDRYRQGETEAREEYPDDDPAPAHFQPEAVYEAKETLDAYTRAIASLPSHCREAFVLHAAGGFTDGEIAKRMGISVSMVEKYLIRGRAVCKAYRMTLESF